MIDPASIFAALKALPELGNTLSSVFGGGGGSKYQNAIQENMLPGRKDYGGLKSSGEATPTFGGEVTVTARDPNNQITEDEQMKEGGEKGEGGLPLKKAWMEKLGKGLEVGEAFQQKPPDPPRLPGGGRFDHRNSVLEFLQMMGRR